MSFRFFSRGIHAGVESEAFPPRVRLLSALRTGSPSHPIAPTADAMGPRLRGVLRLRAGWRRSRWTHLLRRFAQDDTSVFMVGFGTAEAVPLHGSCPFVRLATRAEGWSIARP
jgi:hypothetical protein